MEKITFIFLNELELKEFLSVTTSVLLKRIPDELSVVCNCSGKECTERGIIEQAQIYGATVIRENLSG